jgi:DNA polymerase-3 subunit alpha
LFKKGIKPVLGSVIRLNDAEHRATLLAMSSKGWRNLTEIVSRGFIEGQQLSIPCVQKEWILEQSEDLIVLLGQHSDVGKMLCSSNPQKAEPLLEAWIEKFGNRVYLALTRTERVGEEDFIQQAVKLAAKYQIGVVAHNDVHFVEQDDFEAHEARVCIADGYVLVMINVLRIIALNSILKLVSKCLNYLQTSQVQLKILIRLPNVVMLPYN